MTKPFAKDEADLAQEHEEVFLRDAFWRATHQHMGLKAGHCNNCQEACSGLFCDVGCRQDYERREAKQRRTHAQGAATPRPILRLPTKPKKPIDWSDPAINERKEKSRSEPSERRGEYDMFTKGRRNGPQ